VNAGDVLWLNINCLEITEIWKIIVQKVTRLNLEEIEDIFGFKRRFVIAFNGSCCYLQRSKNEN
jgi:hypothetical protein